MQIPVHHVVRVLLQKQKVCHLVVLVILAQHQMRSGLAVTTVQPEHFLKTVFNVKGVLQDLWLYQPKEVVLNVKQVQILLVISHYARIVQQVHFLLAVYTVHLVSVEPILRHEVQIVHIAQLGISLTPHNQDAVLAYRAAGLVAETTNAHHAKTALFQVQVNQVAPNVKGVPNRMIRNRNVRIVLPVHILPMECNVSHAYLEPILPRAVLAVHLAQQDISLTPHNQDAVLAYRAAGLVAETTNAHHAKTALFQVKVNQVAPSVTGVPNQMIRNRNVRIVQPVHILPMECDVSHAHLEPILRHEVQAVHFAQLDIFLTPTNQDAVLAYLAPGQIVETMSANHVKTAMFPLAVRLNAPSVSGAPSPTSRNQNV